MQPSGVPPSPPDPPARPLPELRPPAGASPGRAPGATWSARAVLVLLAGALGLAVAAVVLLPALVGPPGAGPEPRSAVAPAPPAPDPATPPGEARLAAERALQGYLKQRAQLELLGAEAWGGDELGAAAAAVAAGDRSFGQRRFVDAAAEYAAATQRLTALEASRPERLAVALAAAGEALEAGDGAAAARQYKMALSLEPGLEEAERGLARAEARAAVLDQMAAGRLAELAGRLEEAEAAYRDAMALDQAYAPAADAAGRVAARREELAFGQAMSAALTALDAGRYAAAQQGLDAAKRLRPEDRAVRDALHRLAAARRGDELARHRTAAEAGVAAEAWGEAAGHYRAALRVDPAAGFASAGLARAERQAQLNERIDHYLAEPTRLHSPEPLAEAERLLAAAAGAPATEPKLAAKTARLAALVRAAQTPRPVTLLSDGATEVTLFHVARLGAFTEHRLELRPGRYTALGARPGYRDVRVTFTVGADLAPAPVDVRCQERL